MSPNGPGRSGKIVAASNIYTIILAVAFCVVVATSAYVAYMCYTQYGTIWKIQ